MNKTQHHNWLTRWLKETDEQALGELWRQADDERQKGVGDTVHLRGLIEFSNICRRNCMYCGLRAANTTLERYLMEGDEILKCAHHAVHFGYGTIVLQAGESDAFSAAWLADVIGRIKRDSKLAVTLSVGERPERDFAMWRDAGADRYLLRFETSNPDLYSRIHPARDGNLDTRLKALRMLQKLGYEVGSGVLIGIPGQTFDILAQDIAAFRHLELDMIGVGPFIPHPATPLGNGKLPPAPPAEQVPASELMTYKVLALTRLTCPLTNIPSTTALATLNNAEGREFGLTRGANVVMPNLTPATYRALYEIYPAKACINETAEACHHCMKQRIRSLGRSIGKGQGNSAHYMRRQRRPSHAGSTS